MVIVKEFILVILDIIKLISVKLNTFSSNLLISNYSSKVGLFRLIPLHIYFILPHFNLFLIALIWVLNFKYKDKTMGLFRKIPIVSNTLQLYNHYCFYTFHLLREIAN